MRPLSSRELLDVWEQGQSLRRQQRALLLLATAESTSPDSLNDLIVGERDRRLFRLRERAFGSRLGALATCPHCATRLEFDLDTDEVCADGRPEPESTLRLVEGEYEVDFRLPTGGDLATIETCTDPTEGSRQLLGRCIVGARRNDIDLSSGDLPARVVDAIGRRMSDADPQADLRLSLVCPACAFEWSAAFDIASFFWDEIHAWALRLLRAVHGLASAYGWREADVLALSPWRRQIYLEMADQ